MDRMRKAASERETRQSPIRHVAIPRQAEIGFCILLIAMACCQVFAGSAYADNEVDGPSRTIAVVYDDSTSMNADTAWCQAHYAIEVFAAMLDEGDELAVFTMSAADEGDTRPDLVISGSESMQQRVAKAHGDFSRIDAWTNFGAANNAYAYLSSKPVDSEKWLVVLTDGAFNIADELGAGSDLGMVAERVRTHLAEWAAAGVNVEYVGLGSEAVAFEGGGRFSARVIPAGSILDGVIEESNKIFGRAQLPESSYSDGSLDIGVPMGKIIVFAQGEDVKVGMLSVDGASYDPAALSEVHYADKPNVKQTPDAEAMNKPPIDESLQGVVATFETDGGFPAGKASLDVQNADAVAVYYQPYVNVELTLTDKATGETTTLDGTAQSSLQPGTYRSDYKLLDPFTGKEITSDLIRSTTFATQMTVGEGEPIDVPDGEDVTIPEGKAELIGIAVINDEVVVPQLYDVVILAKDLDVSVVSSPSGAIDVHELDSAEPIVVKVTKQGANLTEAEWDATDLAVGSPDAVQPEGLLGWLFGSEKGVGSEWTRGTEPGTYEIRLKTFNGEPADTLDGEVPITVKATYDPGYGQSYGELNTSERIQGVGLLERILHWILTHLPQLGLLLFLFLLFAFIIMELRKPRLPRNSRPVLNGVEENPEISITFARKQIKHVIWPPWSPETGYYKVRPRDGIDYNFNQRFPLGLPSEGTLSVVAKNTPKGKRGFMLSDASMAKLERHMDEEWHKSHGFPNPDYDCTAKTIFAKGRSLGFRGNAPDPMLGFDEPHVANYEIRF